MNPNQFRWMMALTVLAGLLGGGVTHWLWMDQTAYAKKPGREVMVLRAEKFELVDKAGHEHGSLSMGPDGNPAFVLYDVDHNVRLVAELMANGNPRLFFSDQEGRIRNIVGTTADGSPILQLKGKDRQVIWSAP